MMINLNVKGKGDRFHTAIRLLAPIFIILMAIDGILTFWATNNGYSEANPLMAPFASNPFFPVLKVIFALGIVALLDFISKCFPKLNWVIATGYGMAVVLYTLVVISNIQIIT